MGHGFRAVCKNMHGSKLQELEFDKPINVLKVIHEEEKWRLQLDRSRREKKKDLNYLV